MEYRVFDSIPQIAAQAGELITGPNVAVSGGSTYKEIFAYWGRLSHLKKHKFFVVDERLVPFEDETCNWKVATRLLLEPLGLESQKSHWAQSQIQYGDLLKKQVGSPPVFDQIFLGMGDDGHTASLFPGGAELSDSSSVLLTTRSPKPPVQRLTLGLSVLWSCVDLILIVTGRNKAGLVKQVIEGDETLPISLALGGHRKPLMLLDQEAAGQL